MTDPAQEPPVLAAGAAAVPRGLVLVQVVGVLVLLSFATVAAFNQMWVRVGIALVAAVVVAIFAVVTARRHAAADDDDDHVGVAVYDYRGRRVELWPGGPVFPDPRTVTTLSQLEGLEERVDAVAAGVSRTIRVGLLVQPFLAVAVGVLWVLPPLPLWLIGLVAAAWLAVVWFVSKQHARSRGCRSYQWDVSTLRQMREHQS